MNKAISLLIAILALIACDASDQKIITQPKTLSPGDSIVFDNATYTISDQGTLNMPYVGRLEVQGLTTDQALAKINAAYSKAEIYTNPIHGIAPP